MIYCEGEQCPVKNTCLRHTGKPQCCSKQNIMRKCTSQKRYMQDEEKINSDSKRR